MEIRVMHCEKCGHNWSTKLDWPKRCARCNCENWWRPKRSKAERVPKPEGRPPKYPVGHLEVGQSARFDFHLLPNGQPDFKANVKMNNAICHQARRKGIVLVRQSTPSGLNVTRVR